MFGIGFTEMVLIAVVILIAVGPKRLPQLMKTVGQGMREIRRASSELRRSVGFDEMMREADVRQMLREPAQPARPRRTLNDDEREQERPPMGVDVAEAAHKAVMGEPLSADRAVAGDAARVPADPGGGQPPTSASDAPLPASPPPSPGDKA